MNPCWMRRSRLSRSLALLLAYLIALGPLHVALAGPEGGVVVGGSAVIDASTPGVTAISQGSQRAVIDWRGFSSATGEAIRFAQPSSTAAVLNRVTGPDASLLRGSLTANGHVFLLNPNGIVFGPTSQVDVGSLVASSLEMTNADFMAGRHNLAASPSRALAAVVNQGAIRTAPGGAVALVGPVVSNQGVIEAPSGRVALAAGTRAVVNLDGGQLVNLALPEGTARDVAVPAAGVSDALKRAVNDDGIVEAGSVQDVGGRIVLGGAEGLAMNEGTIDASASAGQSAGHVRVTSTRATVVAPGARITASGVGGRSNGGDVRLLSGGTTVFARKARIEAMGGASGDGGFVEVSGEARIFANGSVDTSAADGQTGMYLIDPQDIRIVNGSRASTDLDGAAGDGLVSTGDPDAGANTISEAVLEGLIGTQITLQATNSITIEDIDDGVGDKLTLNGSLELRTLNGNITFLDPTNTVEITFGAGASVSIYAGTAASAVASVTLGNITDIGNNINVTSGTAGGDITFGTIDAGTGSVDMNAPLGNITGGAITGGGILLRANSSVGAPKNVAVGAMTSRVGSVQLFAGNPGGNALDGRAQSYRGGVSFTSINAAADAVVRFGNGDVTGGDVTAGGEINIQATFDDGLPGNITLGRVTTDGNPTTVPDASFDPFGDIVLRSGYGGGDIRFNSLTNRRTGVFVLAVAGDVVGGDVRGGPAARNVGIASRRAPTGGSVTVGNVIADAANVALLTDGLGGNISYTSIAANQAGVPGSGGVKVEAAGGSVTGGAITAAGDVFNPVTNTREAIAVRASSTPGASGGISIGDLLSTGANLPVILHAGNGNITVGTLNAGTASVDLRASNGAIIDGNGGAPNVISGNLHMVAGGSDIGSLADRFDTNSSAIQIESGGGPGAARAFITNTGNVAIGPVRVTNGFDLISTAGITTAGSLISDTGAVRLESGSAAGDITFTTVAALAGSVTMNAPLGNITGGAVTGATGITLLANSAVGAPKNVAVGTLTSSAGSVQLFAGNPGGNALDGQAQSYRGGVTFTSISAGADAVVRFGNGDVTGGDVTAGGEINIQATFNDGLPGNITLGQVTTDGNPTTVPDASFDPFGDIVLRSGYGGGDIRFTSLTNRRTGVFVNAVAGDVVGGDVRGGPAARNVVIESRKAPTGGSVTVGNVIADAANVGLVTAGLGGNIRYASIAANQAGVDGSGRVQLDAPGGSVGGGSITAAGSKANTREAIIVRTSSTAGATGSIAVGALRSTQAGASIVLQSRAGQGSSSGGAVSVPSIETNNGRVTIDSFDPITFTSIAADTVILANGRGDLRFSAPPSGGPNVTARVLTVLSSHIGSDVNPLRTRVSGLNALAGGGSMHIQNSGSLTLGTVVASADLTGDVFITATGGDLSVGEVSATREVSLSTPDGSILRAGQGVLPNIIARKATLSARDVIGTLAAPLDVDVGGSREGLEGTLTESHGVQLTGELLTGNPRTQGRLAPPLGGVAVSASGLRDGVSVDITGVARPANTLTIVNCPPGLVIFNGVPLDHHALIPTIVPTPPPTVVPTPPATPPPTATVQPLPTSTPTPLPSVVPTPTPPPTVVPTPTPTSQPPPPVVILPPQLGAREQLAGLLSLVQGLGLTNSTYRLYAKLEVAQRHLEQGDTKGVVQQLRLFKRFVNDEAGTTIPSQTAKALIAAADEIIAAVENAAR